MSYSEENGQVVLTMSQEDYEMILMALGALMAFTAEGKLPIFTVNSITEFVNRLNEGNPHFHPYQVMPRKHDKSKRLDQELRNDHDA